MSISDKPKEDSKQAVGFSEVLKQVRHLKVIDLRGIRYQFKASHTFKKQVSTHVWVSCLLTCRI